MSKIKLYFLTGFLGSWEDDDPCGICLKIWKEQRLG